MRFYLISDNIDTALGLRLAGVEGIVAHTPEALRAALERCVGEPDIAVVLITARVAALLPDFVQEHKMRGRPLILLIPDRHGEGDPAAEIDRYMQSAIGVKN